MGTAKACIAVASSVSLLALLCACGSKVDSTPPGVSRTYVVDIEYQANGCNLPDLEQGTVARYLITITQQGTSLIATSHDASGNAAAPGLGLEAFSGVLVGSDATMTWASTAPQTVGSCTFTTAGTAHLSFDAHGVQGMLTYTGIPVMSTSSCAGVQGCETTAFLYGGG